MPPGCDGGLQDPTRGESLLEVDDKGGIVKRQNHSKKTVGTEWEYLEDGG